MFSIGNRKISGTSMEFILLTVLVFISCSCGGTDATGSKGELSILPGEATLEATLSQQFTVAVKNLPDRNVSWEIAGCNISDCGTISSNGLYRAPSLVPLPATARIQATSRKDLTISDTARVSLLPLSVKVPEDTMTMRAGESHKFAASVVGHPNKTVRWSLSECTGSDCGTIDASGLYMGPSMIPERSTVKVTATSQADSTKSDSVMVYNVPIAVSITPSDPFVFPGDSLSFDAEVQYDLVNEGVTWALGPGCTPETCGTLIRQSNTSVLYTAPDAVAFPQRVSLIATSVSDNAKTATADITVSEYFPHLRAGNYAFYFSGDNGIQDSTTVWAAAAGRFHADGKGTITDGLLDMNLPSGVFTAVPFSGTDTVGPGYTGILEIATTEGDFSYLMTVDPSGIGGKFISFKPAIADASIAVSGDFERQDEDAFSLTSIAGSYAIGISSGGREMAAIGRFDIDTSGYIGRGRMDVSERITDGHYYTPSSSANLALTGFVTEPSSSTGRGTVTINLTPKPSGGAGDFRFSYYIVSNQRVMLAEIDERTSNAVILSGEMQRQQGSFSLSSLDAPCIFSLTGLSVYSSGLTIGQLIPDGAGSAVGVIDISDDTDISMDREFEGSYTVESDGRSEIAVGFDYATWEEVPVHLTGHYVGYLSGRNRGFLMQSDGFSGLLPSLGTFKPQGSGPFAVESISDIFLTNTIPGLSDACAERIAGLTTFDEAGNVSSVSGVNQCGNKYNRSLIGSYTVNGNGRGVITFDDLESHAVVFWIISNSEMVGIFAKRGVAVSDKYFLGDPVLVEYRK